MHNATYPKIKLQKNTTKKKSLEGPMFVEKFMSLAGTKEQASQLITIRGAMWPPHPRATSSTVNLSI